MRDPSRIFTLFFNNARSHFDTRYQHIFVEHFKYMDLLFCILSHLILYSMHLRCVSFDAHNAS